MGDVGRLLRMDGKVALVTGGGRGIGRAVCELLDEAGAQVLVCDLDGASASAVAEGLAHGEAIVADISDEQAVEAMYRDIAARHGRLDALIHVAAIFPKRDFLKMTAAQWDQMQAVNVRGTFLMMRETIKAMKSAGHGGSIVNISSASGERALVTNNSAYGASKAAVTNLTRSMAIEVAADSIRINAVLPGGVATEGAQLATETMLSDGLTLAGPMMMPGRLPMGRSANPAEIAAACLFLASGAASYITGQALAVDGGFLVS
jgi:NAD(P)-dependent dehydrogenase (short-subunit alcohol dehydrogenase family)